MRRILEPGVNCWQVGAAVACNVLVDADAYYRAFYAAASRAQRHISLAGWQFDTEVALLRGPAAERARYPVRLLAFLDALCRERPNLRVRILAWDYSVVYSLEREWLQGLKFAFQTGPAIQFEFDAHPHFAGSHHQKLAIIDGVLAFAGGLDLCDERWDDRAHTLDNPLRTDDAGQPARPNHEVQASVKGPVVSLLSQLFCERWTAAVGERLTLEPVPDSPVLELELPVLDRSAVLPMRAPHVAIARTVAGTPQAREREIERAYCDAFSAAERLIYVETQYFTSRVLTEALCQRLRDAARPALQVLIVMPNGADNAKERFALGDLQSDALSELESTAAAHGHELRLLCSAKAGAREATFIHSKLLIVDDQLLSVGSANMTDRSMALDSELCLLWQAAPGSDLSRDIQRVRASLLAEHSGRDGNDWLQITGLVQRLDAWIAARATRLRACHFDPTSASPFKKAIFDPLGPLGTG